MYRNMSRKYQKSWSVLPLLLAGSLIVLASFRKIGFSKEKQIQTALKGTGLESYSPFLVAMAKHESGNFKNNLSMKYNNVFSMGYPNVRPSINSGFAFLENNPFKWSKYSSVTQATKDLVKYLEYNRFPKNSNMSIESFISWLKQRRYFEDDYFNYLNGVKRFL